MRLIAFWFLFWVFGSGEVLAQSWSGQDIGSVNVAGSSAISGTVYPVRGSGADIAGTADACYFMAQPLTSDGTVIARVFSVQNTNTAAKAGLMVRQSAAGNALCEGIFVTPANGISHHRRLTAGATMTTFRQPGLMAPYWLKLTRSGTTFSSYISTTGTDWTLFGSDTIPMTGPVLIGLAVTSRSPSVLCTATFDNVSVIPVPPDGNGTGLRGEYFDGEDFTSPKLTRTDPVIDFNWATGSPDALISSDGFSVRWSGQLQPKFSETYTFYAKADNGVRLWVNGQLLIDQWMAQRPPESFAALSLTAGTAYNLVYEYYEHTGSALATLLWSSNSQPKQTIPRGQLYPAAASVTPTVPANLALLASTPTSVTFGWDPVPGVATGSAYQVYQTPATGGTTTLIGTTRAPSFTASGLSPSTSYRFNVNAKAISGALTASSTLLTATTAPATSALPAPWQSTDIAVQKAGATGFANSRFTVAGAGSGLGGASDSFRLVYLPLSADCSISVKLSGETDTDFDTMAGLAIRGSLAADAPGAFFCLRAGDDNLSFRVRSSAGTLPQVDSEFLDGLHSRDGKQKAPLWLKIARAGNTLTALLSADGVTWEQSSTATLSLPYTAYAGLVVSSHQTAQLANALFENVQTFSSDSDNDGLDDAWEMQHFGSLAHDSLMDTDGDGVSDINEIAAGTDWNDFWNGQTPILSIVDGNNQTGAPGGLAPKPLTVRLTVNSIPLQNLPITFTVNSGGGTVQKSSSAAPGATLTLPTDADGRAKVFFKLPSASNNTSTVTVSAGTGSHIVAATFAESSDNGSGSYTSPFDASDVTATLNADGSLDVSWTNNVDAEDQTPIPVQYMNHDGQWVTLTTVPAGTTSAHIPHP